MSRNMPADLIEYDIRGQICPSTLLIALREINRNDGRLRGGEIALVFITDNRDATQTLPETAGNMGFRSEVTQKDGSYRIKVYSQEEVHEG